ncbi:propanediol utilization protein [Marinovum sp. KMM 9879]
MFQSTEQRVLTRVSGHFGEWVQGRLGPRGPLALVTVNCAALYVESRRLSRAVMALEQQPDILDLPQAEAFLGRVGGEAGAFSLVGTMPAGGGAGASTAALVALARAAGGCETRLAAACLATEGASDPLMLPRPDGVLWAPREGRVLEPIEALPRAEIVGGFWGPPVATDPSDLDFSDISDLVPTLRAPMSLAALADIASESARRCTDLRGPTDDPTPQLAQQLGALGHLRAHTGSARGLIFAPGTVPAEAAPRLRAAGLSRVLQFQTGGPA